MFHLPLLSHPLGWLVLGIGGYALYRSGKNQAQHEAAAVPPDSPARGASATSQGKEAS